MRKPFLTYLIPLCLCPIFTQARMSAQNALVQGTVATSTTVVRNAFVTFEETAPPGATYAVLTDSAGKYQLELTLTSVGPQSSLPAKFELAQNYPNPFVSSTAIAYALKTQSDINVTVYDVLGRVVRTMVVGTQSAGPHGVVWDGRNTTGHQVAPGIYFYHVQAGGDSQVKKMVLAGNGGGLVGLPFNSSFSSPGTIGGVQRRVSGGTFTVRISNSGTTTPTVVPKQIDNVAIQGDTTLDLVAEDQVLGPVAEVYMDSVQQSIRGFGAANILPWRPDMTPDQVQKAFGAGQGQLGFSILRLRIPFTDDPGEFAAQVPTAQLAQSLGAIVFASPWTPPPAMKSSNNIVGGILNDSSYAAYAMHLKTFADYMSNNGVPLYAVSLQNEPDANVTYESCSWNSSQFLKFMRYNAPTIGTRVMMPEGQNFVHALSDSTLNDSLACAHVGIVGGHIYGGGLGPYPLVTSKGKEIWMTEHLDLDTTWTGVFGTGAEIHNCMNAGMNAYVWWYIVRYYGPIGEDGSVTKRGYVMSQFSRFIRPGFFRIACHTAPQRNVTLSAYRNTTSSRVVIVALNTSASAMQQTFALSNNSPASFDSYTTSRTRNCATDAVIVVNNGAFTATLDPSSITTFVSK